MLGDLIHTEDLPDGDAAEFRGVGRNGVLRKGSDFIGSERPRRIDSLVSDPNGTHATTRTNRTMAEALAVLKGNLQVFVHEPNALGELRLRAFRVDHDRDELPKVPLYLFLIALIGPPQERREVCRVSVPHGQQLF